MQAEQRSSCEVGRAFVGSLRWTVLGAAAVLLLAAVGPVASSSAAAKDGTDKEKQKEELKHDDLVLNTADGLELTLTYYPGTKGKETIPVVLLHMWKQNRNDYKDFALTLQGMGYAVVVPDLRGHGESTHLKGARREENLKAASLPPAQFAAMVTQDMKAVKEFLWERNNAGELNIDKLCVVGAEMGASVALNFALADVWDQDRNRVIRSDYKLGRFVKALVLISPDPACHGLPLRAAAANPVIQHDIAMMILVGKKIPKALGRATQVYGMFEKSHVELSGDTKIDKCNLFFLRVDTSLQGTKLLDPNMGVGIELYTHKDGAKKFPAKVTVPELIADFIHRRLERSEESRDWTWRERKVPHE
jgi:pimeloyl-ACP methyl ester carboxylesterase